MRFLVELGPGYWLARLIAVDRKGHVRKLRDGRDDIWNLGAPAGLRAYRRSR